MIRLIILVSALSSFLILPSFGQVYKNPKAAIPERAKYLMSKKTIAEKIGQMNMTSLKESLGSNIGYSS